MARSVLPPLPWRRTARRARRSILLRWLLVALAGAVTAVQADRVGAEAEAARRSWGAADEVAVATRSLPAGHRLRASDLRLEPRPLAVVPDGALDEAPVGQVLTAAVVAGEVVVDSRLAPAGLRGAAALVPDGWRAMSVSTASGLGPPAPPLTVGDRVDLLAPDVVAEDAVVIAVDDDAVTVAVPASDAPAVAEALATAVVTLALRGASS